MQRLQSRKRFPFNPLSLAQPIPQAQTEPSKDHKGPEQESEVTTFSPLLLRDQLGHLRIRSSKRSGSKTI
jgi:hypothetical protein